MERTNKQNTTLKKKASQTLLLNMIQTTREKVSASTFLILVLDDFTAKIISSFLTMTQVLNEGIFSVERLDTVRQKFPNYHALYFISPNPKSIEKINEDFENESKPQYSRIHVFFSHRISDTYLGLLATPNAYPRIVTCVELNLSFLAKDRNLFDIAMSQVMEIYTVKNNDNCSKIISQVGERLFTICAVLKEYPYIQYQKSAMCTQLATILDAQMKEFYKDNGNQYNEKRGILLLLDRTFDVTTPLLHDYNYETMVYDLFEVKDQIISLPDSKNVFHKYELNEKDDLWMKYKNKHFVIALQELQEDFDKFKVNASKFQKAGESESFEEMADFLHGVKDYKTRTAQFSLHLNLAEEMTKKFKELGLNNVIELEQDIVSGINSDGSSADNKKIMEKYITMSKDIKDDNDRLRLLLTMHTCLDFPEKDFMRLLGDITDQQKHRSVFNLSHLGINFSKNKAKSGRRQSGMDKKDVTEFKNKAKTIEYNFLRTSPKLESIALGCSNIELNTAEFPFISDIPKKAGKSFGGNMFGNNTDEDLPNLIVFVLGGMSHGEITSVEGVFSDKEKKLNHNLVLGSTSIINAAEYIKNLQELPTETEVGEKGVTELKSIELKIID